MKRFKGFAAVTAALFITAIIGGIVHARVTSSSPGQRDIFCVGPSGAEVCVDSSGNLISTTDNDADLGANNLYWKNLYLSGTLISSGAVTAGNAQNDTFTINGGSVVVPVANLFVSSATSGNSSGLPILFLDATNRRVAIAGKTPAAALEVTGTANISGVTTIASSVTVRDAELRSSTATILGALYSGTRLYAGQVSTISANGDISAARDISAVRNSSARDLSATFGVSAASASLTGAITSSTATFIGGVSLYSYTIAQLDLLTPTASGQLFLCSDCAGKPGLVSAVVMSSGTGTGAFVDASSTTAHVGAAHF